jgi:hypothetical protein
MSEPPRRDFVGDYRGLAERTRVFRTPEALEVDTSDHYEIRRRRVFYDEVLLVTLHQGRSGGVYPLLLVLGALTVALFIAVAEDPLWDRIFQGLTAFFVLAAAASFFLPAWTVTVYGRRTRARVRFRLREGKARTVYAEICRAVAAAQQRSVETVSSVIPDLPEPPPPAGQAGEG